MTISFDAIPANTRVPFMYVEFNSEGAQPGPPRLRYRAVILGQVLDAAIAAGTEKDVPIRVTNAKQVELLAGAGSMLHLMAEAWFANNTSTELHVVPLEDESTTKATWTLTAGGSGIEAGTVHLRIGGRVVSASVADADSPTDVAAAIAAAIVADDNLPVVATADAAVATLVAKNAGAAAGDIPIMLNFREDQELPAGLTLAIERTVAGGDNPDLEDALAGFNDEWYHIVVTPYTDTDSLEAVHDELEERFGPLAQKDGIAMSAARGTHGALTTLGQGPNSRQLSILALPGNPAATQVFSEGVPHAPYSWASAYAAVAAFHLEIDPARPLQTLQLAGPTSPRREDRFGWTERNQLLFDGASTFFVDEGGRPRIERAITTYRTTPIGADDIAYLNVNTRATLMLMRYEFRNLLLTKYPRHKLANDGNRFAPGQKVMTPSVAKAEAVSLYESWISRGLAEDLEGFKAALIVERDPQDPDRLNFFLAPNLANQLRVGAAQIAFLLFQPEA